MEEWKREKDNRIIEIKIKIEIKITKKPEKGSGWEENTAGKGNFRDKQRIERQIGVERKTKMVGAGNRK